MKDKLYTKGEVAVLIFGSAATTVTLLCLGALIHIYHSIPLPDKPSTDVAEKKKNFAISFEEFKALPVAAQVDAWIKTGYDTSVAHLAEDGTLHPT